MRSCTASVDADPRSAVIRSALAQSWADLGYDLRAAPLISRTSSWAEASPRSSVATDRPDRLTKQPIRL